MAARGIRNRTNHGARDHGRKAGAFEHQKDHREYASHGSPKAGVAEYASPSNFESGHGPPKASIEEAAQPSVCVADSLSVGRPLSRSSTRRCRGRAGFRHDTAAASGCQRVARRRANAPTMARLGSALGPCAANLPPSRVTPWCAPPCRLMRTSYTRHPPRQAGAFALLHLAPKAGAIIPADSKIDACPGAMCDSAGAPRVADEGQACVVTASEESPGSQGFRRLVR